MSALRKPTFTSQYYSAQPQFKPKPNYQQQSVNLQKQPVQKVVKNRSFPQQNKLPKNLQVLSLLQKASFGLALVSLTASLGLYTATVRIPELWSEEYRNLENLQRQERELTAINEKIKYQIARDASDSNRLSISKPESAVFISPAKFSPKKDIEARVDNIKVAEIKQHNFGY